MSWDAHLYTELDGREVQVGSYDWNYTYNTNRMVTTAVEELGKEVPSWWLNNIRKKKGDYWCGLLHGMTGRDGAKFLSEIIEKMANDPRKYKAMNPDNGWGSYDGILSVLRDMRDAGQDWPSAKYHII